MMNRLKTYGCLTLMAVAALGVAMIDAARADTAPAQEIVITVQPHTLQLDSASTWVTVHCDIPYASVSSIGLTMNGIPVAWTKADLQGNLVLKFQTGAVKAIVAPPSAELTVQGMTKLGVPFYGTDTVEVVACKKG